MQSGWILSLIEYQYRRNKNGIQATIFEEILERIPNLTTDRYLVYYILFH